MASRIRNGLIAVLVLAIIALGARLEWLQWSLAAAERDTSSLATSFNGSPARLSQTGQNFVLEVRGVGIVTGWQLNDEIWQAIESKADNHSTYLSANPEDYPDSDDARLERLRIVTGAGFQYGAGHAVDRWPVPVIAWAPRKDKASAARAAMSISGGRHEAGLGVTLFLWQDDANTDDGAAMIGKLFQFFDTHPDVPAALVFCRDGSLVRDLLGAPGSGGPSGLGHVIPAMPDSVGALLVTRSDRVDRLIRPFAVDQTAAVNKTNTDYDIIKLWNFYWHLTDDQSPDGFDAQFLRSQKEAGVMYPRSLGVMSSSWWQAHLPEFWKTINNQGPGAFKPSPYIPVRWTTWQLKQFDNAPLFGYLHRPVDVKLTDDQGKPLRVADQAQALKAGWEKAVAALPGAQEPKRVFYDTTGDRQWAIPLNQALAQVGKSAPSLDDVKEGYDIGTRIGNTGVSSPLVQIGLGLMASYEGGGASATVNRRPNGMASIVMVSPPDASVKAAWDQKRNGVDPFGLKP